MGKEGQMYGEGWKRHSRAFQAREQHVLQHRVIRKQQDGRGPGREVARDGKIGGGWMIKA